MCFFRRSVRRRRSAPKPAQGRAEKGEDQRKIHLDAQHMRREASLGSLCLMQAMLHTTLQRRRGQGCEANQFDTCECTTTRQRRRTNAESTTRARRGNTEQLASADRQAQIGDACQSKGTIQPISGDNQSQFITDSIERIGSEIGDAPGELMQVEE